MPGPDIPRVQLTGELGRLVFGNAARLRAFP